MNIYVESWPERDTQHVRSERDREKENRTVLLQLSTNDVLKFKLCQLIVGPINSVNYRKFQRNSDHVLLAENVTNSGSAI